MGHIIRCLVCRVIHTEVVEEFSSSSFINALKRFLATRGPICQCGSDRGPPFCRSSLWAQYFGRFLEEESVNFFTASLVQGSLISFRGIVWLVLPGECSRILDSMLFKTNQKDLTHENLTTFIAEVTAAVVDSRPLTNLSEDPSYLVILTPSMLLTHKSGQLPMCIPLLGPQDIYKAQWKHVQLLVNEFWKRLQRDYLSSLQSRVKWTGDAPNVKRDTIVMCDTDSLRYKCSLAVVIRTFPSDDSRVRNTGNIKVDCMITMCFHVL